jgi:NADH dehydrogenase
VLIEAGPDVLGTFPPPLREAAKKSLERLGVEVRTGVMVTNVDREGVMLRATSAPNDPPTRLSARTVLWAAGVAASPLAQSLGVPLDRAGRVTPEPTLALAAHPEIFVVGDLASLKQDGQPLPGVAQVAMQGGAHAARNVLRAVRREPLLPFRYRNYGNAATIGRGSAVFDFGWTRVSGLIAWVFWLILHLFWFDGGVGVVVLHVSTGRSADHRGTPGH